MGKNEWREASCFPLPSTYHQYWYLSSKKGARSFNGDGVLSLIQQNGGSDFDSYIFDPMDPVPTKGGVNFHFFGKVRQKVFHNEKYPSHLILTVLNKE